MSKKLGVVLWFDNQGEGEVYCPSDKCHYYVHYSAILNKDEFKMLKKHYPVEFTIYENLYMKQIDKIWDLSFDYGIDREYKINNLLNNLAENGCDYMFEVSENFYKEEA